MIMKIHSFTLEMWLPASMRNENVAFSIRLYRLYAFDMKFSSFFLRQKMFNL